MGPKLGYGEHPPLFLGMYPLSVGVQVICVVHAIVCICVVAFASSVVDVEVLEFQVQPHVQVGLAAWHLIGVALSVSALMGTIWRQHQPLQWYFVYLLAATLSWCYVLCQIFHLGSTCEFVSRSHATQRIGLTFSCVMVSAAWELGALTILVSALYACWTVYHLAEDMALREETQHLLQYEDPAIKRIRSGYAPAPSPAPPVPAPARAAPAAASPTARPMRPPIEWASPLPGAQPAWGSVFIGSTSFAP